MEKIIYVPTLFKDEQPDINGLGEHFASATVDGEVIYSHIWLDSSKRWMFWNTEEDDYQDPRDFSDLIWLKPTTLSALR